MSTKSLLVCLLMTWVIFPNLIFLLVFVLIQAYDFGEDWGLQLIAFASFPIVSGLSAIMLALWRIQEKQIRRLEILLETKQGDSKK